jgi:putative membrane protein
MRTVPGWGSWSLNPIVILALLGAALLYARAYRRASARSGSALGPGHWVPYGCGLVALAVALLSPLDAIGDRWLLSAHMGQHVLLSDVAPALLLLGLRAPLLPLGLSPQALQVIAPGARTPASRVLARLTSPWLAIPLWAVATWAWAIPSVFDYAAEHQLVHAIEHATLFYTGLALWWLIVDPLPRARLRPHGERLALLGFSRLASACVCLPLTWLSKTEYPLYANAPRAFGISAINDQHLAGAGMCFVEFLVFGIAFAAVFISMLGRSDAQVAIAERAAGDRQLI